MYQQEVKGKKTSPLAGIGMIALIVLSICLAGFLEQVLALIMPPAIASILVWALAGLEIFMLLRLNSREFLYTLNEERFIIYARYGGNVRPIHDIPLASLLAVGPEEEVFAVYGNGQAYDRVFSKSCPLPSAAMAYTRDGSTRLLTFQPDEELLSLLRERLPAGEN